MTARLSLSGVGKRFGTVIANDDVSLAVEPGEIHALLGENGAGKSTLVKIIYGLLQPDAGSISWQGAPTRIASPHVARALGIGMVFQHFSLFEAMTVLENVALGLDGASADAALAQRVQEVSRGYGLPLDPARSVHELSVGERQRIEIVRCLLQEPRLLIMDEPTSVLTPQEADRLFETLRRLASEGVSILYISHKLDEIRRLCHRATILRSGRVVAACDPSQESARSLAELMVGQRLDSPRRAVGVAAGPVRFAVQDLSLPPLEPHGITLHEVALEVRAGEVLGIAGVAGNGQTELAAALAGERRTAAAAILLDGRAIGHLGTAARRAAGLGYLPEERNGHAAVGTLPLTDNALLTAARRRSLSRGGLIDRRRLAAYTDEIVATFGVRAGGIASRAASLSGGNLQKFVVGREILQRPQVLIVAQPTWGVDASAAAVIHRALIELAAAGTALLVISQDLDELLALTDRLAVINAGRLSRPLPTAEADVAEIGLLMGGSHGADAAPVAHAA